MGVIGKYVASFAEATHALPEGMHMNADYPFMIPRVDSFSDNSVTLVSEVTGEKKSCRILMRGDSEVCELKQSSTYERMFRQPPTKYVFHPFKEDRS